MHLCQQVTCDPHRSHTDSTCWRSHAGRCNRQVQKRLQSEEDPQTCWHKHNQQSRQKRTVLFGKKMRLTTRIKTFRCFPRSLLQKFQYCPNHKRGSSALNLRFPLLTDGDLTDHLGRLSFFLDFISGGYFCEFVCPFCLHEVKSPWSHEHDLAKAV